MKKRIIFVILLSVSVLNAAIITVDNKVPSAGNYTTLQAAHDAASNGDIIYVFPSLVAYNAITVTKLLTFYGVGFDITETIGEPFTTTASISGDMIFNSGSSGSILEGLDGNFHVTINTNNITIKRNKLQFIIVNSQGYGSSILQNKIILDDASYCINTSASDILILNNIIINLSNLAGLLHGGTNSYIKNNVLKKEVGFFFYSVTNSLVINNIFLGSGEFYNSSSSTFMYNISSGDQIPSGNGNILNIDMNTVFVDHNNYDFHLLTGSPAIGAGENGTDMGIYGGDAPYVDGGFPGLPSILQIQAPLIGSQQSGLDINFKAKSNKE